MRGTLPRILAVMLAIMPGALAFGQNDLPADLHSKSSLSPSEEQTIANWTLANWALVDGEAPDDARDARRRLVEPLLRAETTASFRLAMDRAIGAQLQAAMNGDDVFRGVNAALLSGWLGTDRSVRSLTLAIQGQQVAIRFSSVAGLGNAFRVAGIAPVAFQAQVGDQAVVALAAVLGSSNDRSMLDAAAKALIEAISVPEAAIAGFGARSGERLTEAVGERLNTLPIDDQLGARVPPLLRAMAEIRGAITQRRGNVSTAWRDEILEMYGRAGALGFRYVRAERAGTLDGADAEGTRNAVETAIRVAGTMPTLLTLDPAVQSNLRGLDLAGNFANAPQDGGNGFQRATNDLIRLLGNQFRMPRDRFNTDG
ncbi:MAG: hypothetical protein NCW75_05355 [Phycisphaera sp.]|nr:MAG: hypothetical protein NCW75_05355 [Phycisphaera sp.]